MSEIPSTSPAHVPDHPLVDLATIYAELQALVLADPDVAAFLDGVARLATDIVSPPVSVGITARERGGPVTVAASDVLATSADEVQYGAGQGPCLQALSTGEVVGVPDLVRDDRWPDYRPHALARGVRSSLSLPLHAARQTYAALNLYSTDVQAFEGHADRAGGFARQASTALALVVRACDQARLSDQLRQALTARTVIDQALGILMAQERCTADEAFRVLRGASQHRNLKLRDVAAALVETVTGHPPRPGRPFTDASS